MMTRLSRRRNNNKRQAQKTRIGSMKMRNIGIEKTKSRKASMKRNQIMIRGPKAKFMEIIQRLNLSKLRGLKMIKFLVKMKDQIWMMT